MKKFNMLSSHFSHDISSTPNKTPKYFEWEFFSKNNDISFYIDMDVIKGISDKNDGKQKYLWLLESPCFNNGVFNYIHNNLNTIFEVFEKIFTYNDELIKLNKKKFIWIPAMGSWIKKPQIHKKNKLLSMITSTKYSTSQQIFRVNFAILNIHRIDIYGKGFNEIDSKEEGLLNYMFSICIENINYDTYFTEKILDCFATGTIPIYKGTKKIIEHFDQDGILFLDEIDINNITEVLYYSKMKAIINNFEIVKKYICPEDYIFNNMNI